MPYVPQTSYSIYVAYYWDYGLRGVPLAGPPGTPMQIVAEHAPTCYKYVTWVAQAQDSADPQPPDWNTNNLNEVLVSKALSAPFLTDIGDGTTMSTIAGVYTYLLLIPPADTDILAISLPPWDATLAQVLMPGTFTTGLLNSSITIPNPGGTYAGMQGTGTSPAITKPVAGSVGLDGFIAAVGSSEISK